jgi:hypothetical protein
MERQFKITIPKPCNENWDTMTPNENGRFCMSCSKTVVDFTAMLPDEVQHFFIQNQNNKICGRFKNEQLESLIIQIPSQVLHTQTHYHKIFLLALFIAMGTTLFSCQDKNGNKQKIDKVEIVEDRATQGSPIGGAMAVRQQDCTKKDPEIDMTTGGIATVDPNDNTNYSSIDYDAVFNPLGLDVLPSPEDGIEILYAFINHNYVIPSTIENDTGKTYISFVVEKDGSLSTFKIIREAGTGTGEEAIRVLKMAPKWKPGKLNNHVVRTSYTLPISFKR